MNLEQALEIVKNIVANAQCGGYNHRITIMNAMALIEQRLMMAGQKMIDDRMEAAADPGDAYHESSDNGNEGEEKPVKEKPVQDKAKK